MKLLCLFALLLLPTVVCAQGLEYDRSIDATMKASIQNDLGFMNQIRFTKTTPLHDRIFAKAGYLAWFEKRIWEIGLDPNEKAVGTVAYVDPIRSYNHKMWLTPYYVETNMPLMCRIGNFLHEARHSEQLYGYWHHYYCPTPFQNNKGEDVIGYYSHNRLEGKLACDRYAEGAYGLEVVMYDNIIRNCENCNEKLKTDAAIFRTDLIDRVVIEEATQELLEDQMK